jgi:hypothetical protein
MNISHFIALLKNDLRVAWPFFFLAPFYAYLSIASYKDDHLYDLNPITSGGFFLFFMPFLAFNLLFQSENYGFANPSKPAIGKIEFMFTRAIDRFELFAAKASLFLLFSSLPLLMIWACSYTTPSLKVQLPYSDKEYRQEAKQFYLSHFENAYLQTPDVGTNKDYVVFPKGRINQSISTFMLGLSVTLLFQVILFTFPQRRWLPFVALLLFAVILPLGSFAHIPPTPYEYISAWVVRYTGLCFLVIGFLVVLAEFYCYRRFINTEITS